MHDWHPITVRSSDQFYNGVEAVRVDEIKSVAYVSMAFSSISDTIFLRCITPDGAAVPIQFISLAQYYDNRKAVVTITADDWADWSDSMWDPLLTLFRNRRLFVTVGIISDSAEWCSLSTWKHIQRQLDSGYIETASHSRTHPYIPYNDTFSEVIGSSDDIVRNLSMPLLSRSGDNEYVYVWIAPYGQYQDAIDSLLNNRSYLVTRLASVDDESVSDWNPTSMHFAPVNPVFEIGKPSWGGGDTDQILLKSKFERIMNQGGVYHFMWHPQVIYPDRNKAYLINHLDFISNRNDVWYVNFGHLYLYQMLYKAMSPTVVAAARAYSPPDDYSLEQNFPNPFNSSTTIRIRGGTAISRHRTVTLEISDLLGRIISVPFNGEIKEHIVELSFNASSLASGIYLYALKSGNTVVRKKMIVLK